MYISHEEARRLIHFHADVTLQGNDKKLLEVHLEACLECRNYADSIQELESILRPALHRRWDRLPLPLPTNAMALKKDSSLSAKMAFTTRIVALGIICFAFLFNILQFTQLSGPRPDQPATIVQPVPTPSLQSTSTMSTTQNCELIPYTVQKTDTLESIAFQYSVSVEEIVKANNLDIRNIRESMRLVIPLCGSTLPGMLTSVTTTHTPWFSQTTSTPLGSQIQ